MKEKLEEARKEFGEKEEKKGYRIREEKKTQGGGEREGKAKLKVSTKQREKLTKKKENQERRKMQK